MPRPEAFARASGLLHKSLTADLALLALEPANLEYQWSVSETRFNLADALYEFGEYAQSVDMFRLAAEGNRSRSIDTNDARGQWIVASVDSGLARALAKMDGFDEATTLFAAAEQRLAVLAKNGGTLQIDFALAQVRIRRGEMLEQLANNPHLSAAVRREHARLARESLEQGIANARRVNEVFPLEGGNKQLLDDGVASLARLEGTLAAFTPAR
jgi:tetratricopeptide (TPR) repeat protein